MYALKSSFPSTHGLILKLIRPYTNVLDIGCHTGEVAKTLEDSKKCVASGVDVLTKENVKIKNYEQINIETENQKLNGFIQTKRPDYVLLLDVIEHLSNPEKFLENLEIKKNSVLFISTGNIAFLPVRIQLLFGYFNYQDRGILDKTHKRLFTLDSFKNLLKNTGFTIQQIHFIPAPFPLLNLPKVVSKILLKTNIELIMFFPTLFAFQFLIVAKK